MDNRETIDLKTRYNSWRTYLSGSDLLRVES